MLTNNKYRTMLKKVYILFHPIVLLFWIQFFVVFIVGQNYEVADIDCAIGNNGRELLSARLRKPEGFRGTPIFADDQSAHTYTSVSNSNGITPGSSSSSFNLLSSPITSSSANHILNSFGVGHHNNNPLPSPDALFDHQSLNSNGNGVIKDPPCQIFPDPTDISGRVYILRVSDFTQCGVLKRNGFIHVRVWFPQLPGVVMLSDQEVIIMCKPPSLTITQSKTAGFAGSIPNGARVSGIVEESPGRLEYEVALFRETSNSGGRSVPPPGLGGGNENGIVGGSGAGGSAYVTGMNSQELPVDQAVPIGTRLQLRAKISSDSVWQHAKLMEVSVSPDPKNPTAEGSVALVKDGCRNPELASIIPKQPYRFKDRSNEVVLDFEAFLLSNMGERNTLWLHTQIKACMETQDCTPEFCLDVYQPSGFGRRRRRRRSLTSPTNPNNNNNNNSTSVDGYEISSPISKHWKTILENHQRLVNANLSSSKHVVIPNPTVTNESEDDHDSNDEEEQEVDEVEPYTNNIVSSKKSISQIVNEHAKKKVDVDKSTKFDENIGFSVMMPADYYRSIKINTSPNYECRGWVLTTIGSTFIIIIIGALAGLLSFKLKRLRAGDKSKDPFYETRSTNTSTSNTTTNTGMNTIGVTNNAGNSKSSSIVMTIHPTASSSATIEGDEYKAMGLATNTSSATTVTCSSVKSGPTASASSSISHHHHHHHRRNVTKISNNKYARDTSLYRP